MMHPILNQAPARLSGRRQLAQSLSPATYNQNRILFYLEALTASTQISHLLRHAASIDKDATVQLIVRHAASQPDTAQPRDAHHYGLIQRSVSKAQSRDSNTELGQPAARGGKQKHAGQAGTTKAAHSEARRWGLC